jgi:4-amino-4-deoxy-L-arabinose transferase-like glycosyltransferase
MMVAAVACGAIILFLGSRMKWKKRIVTCCIMALLFLAFEIPWVLWMKEETGKWMVNQWQVATQIYYTDCVKRHFEGEKQP